MTNIEKNKKINTVHRKEYGMQKVSKRLLNKHMVEAGCTPIKGYIQWYIKNGTWPKESPIRVSEFESVIKDLLQNKPKSDQIWLRRESGKRVVHVSLQALILLRSIFKTSDGRGLDKVLQEISCELHSNRLSVYHIAASKQVKLITGIPSKKLSEFAQ